MVAGRVDKKKAFMTLADMAVPPQLQRMVRWRVFLLVLEKALLLLRYTTEECAHDAGGRGCAAVAPAHCALARFPPGLRMALLCCCAIP